MPRLFVPFLKTFIVFQFAASALFAQPTLVTVTGPINNPNGTPWSRHITVSNPGVICGGIKIQASAQDYMGIALWRPVDIRAISPCCEPPVRRLRSCGDGDTCGQCDPDGWQRRDALRCVDPAAQSEHHRERSDGYGSRDHAHSVLGGLRTDRYLGER